MSYFSNTEESSLGCGPQCSCGPCKSGLSGLDQHYEKEKTDEDTAPPPPGPSSSKRLSGWPKSGLRLGYYGYRNGGRFGAPPNPVRPARCLSIDLIVPNTYDALEEVVRRWISTCVASRTEVRPGVPIHRERELVNGNVSLRDIWDRILQFRK